MIARTIWEASVISSPGPEAVHESTYLEFLSCIFKTIENFVWSWQRTSEVDVHGHLLQTSQVTKKKPCALISTDCERGIRKNVYSCRTLQPDSQRHQLWKS